jgi:hypothetical protein
MIDGIIDLVLMFEWIQANGIMQKASVVGQSDPVWAKAKRTLDIIDPKALPIHLLT